MKKTAEVKTREGGPHQGAEMSFEEIGQALGITRGGAWMLYRNAMRKLQHPANRRRIERLRDAVDFKLRREV